MPTRGLVGGHVVIHDTSGANTITFSNLTAVSQLHSWDFHFLP